MLPPGWPSFVLFYLRRKRCAARLARSKAFRWTRGSLASLSASLRTFGFFSRSVALWRSLAVRPSSSTGLSPFFFPNNSYYSSHSCCRCTGKTQHKGIGIHVLKLIVEVLGHLGRNGAGSTLRDNPPFGVSMYSEWPCWPLGRR